MERGGGMERERKGRERSRSEKEKRRGGKARRARAGPPLLFDFEWDGVKDEARWI